MFNWLGLNGTSAQNGLYCAFKQMLKRNEINENVENATCWAYAKLYHGNN